MSFMNLAARAVDILNGASGSGLGTRVGSGGGWS